MAGPRRGDSKLAGNGTYLDGKVGETEIIRKSDDELREGMKRVLTELKEELPLEFYDVNDVIKNGAVKHGAGTWLDEDNPSMQHKANHASMSRHLAEAYCGITKDADSGLHPLLHLACRALMQYTRYRREIYSVEDRKPSRNCS